MLKPVGAACNLHCKYCYYLEKSNLYNATESHLMSEALLEKFIQDYINAQTSSHILFSWHGGETLLRPRIFYQRALQLQKYYGRGRYIENCIQTNGTLLTDDWCKFFKDNNFLVGISIDGPENVHNSYRKYHNGKPTFSKVMHGIELLNKYEVEWNALAVINNLNVQDPFGFYKFFKDINCRYLQFTPIVERYGKRNDGLTLASGQDREGRITDFSITPSQWGNFLCDLFDEWVHQDVGQYFIQLFDATLANWMGMSPGVCTLAKECGHAGVMEYNGDVYSCDHFVFPEYKLGNLKSNTIYELMNSKKQKQFSNLKRKSLPQQCKECKFLFACSGECPKNRFLLDKYGNPGLNYLCEGYFQFFKHVEPYMDFMKNELLSHRPPANVMSYYF